MAYLGNANLLCLWGVIYGGELSDMGSKGFRARPDHEGPQHLNFIL